MTLENSEYDGYLALYNGPTECYRHIRVVFTGKEGAGKTTVCLRLQNKHVDLTTREPTVGAVLHPDWFTIDRKCNTWKRSDDQSPSEVIQKRIGTVKMNIDTANRKTDLLTDSAEEPPRPSSHNPSAYDERVRKEITGAKTDSRYQDSAVGLSRPGAHDRRVREEIRAVETASLTASSDVAFLSLWDMGGHTSFQASHNVFISSHGVYLLVFKLTDFLKDKLETDRLKKWIRLIGTFSSVALNGDKMTTHAPPIVFVGTFLDELKSTTNDCDKQVRAIQSSISKFPELSAHSSVMFCTVDNSLDKLNNNTELDTLRGCITESAVHQDQWDRQLPTRWLKFEMELLKARENGSRILSFAEVVEMNKQSIVPLADEDEIKLALEYLHCTRSVIYFREFDFIINDPQWLVDFFSILITDDEFLPSKDLLLTRDLELYKTRGELTQKLLEGLLSLEKNKAFLPHKSVLLALMEKFGLIVRLRMSGTTTETAQFSDTYTIPSKLVELQDTNGIADEVGYLQQLNLAVSKTLCIVFPNVYVPDELFHRIFARVLKMYIAVSLATQSLQKLAKRDQRTFSNATCLYMGFGCFEVDDLCRMILSMHAERSTIDVTVISTTESQLPTDVGQRVRRSIEQILRDTLQMSNQQHFRYTYQLHCNFHLSPYDTPVNLYGVINSQRGVPCKGGECQAQHRLSKADTTFWDITEDSSTVEDQDSDKETTEDDTNISNRRPTPRELGRLSRLVNASQCEMLFVELGLSDAEIKSTLWESRTRNLAGITQITKLLLIWTSTYPNQTFHHIELAMANVGMATDRIADVLVTDEGAQGEDMVPKEVWSRVPSDAEIEKIVANIGNKFFNLWLELGLSPPIVERHEIGNPDDFKKRMSALLRSWIDRFQRKATIGRLLTAMKVYQMDWHTTAQIWLK